MGRLFSNLIWGASGLLLMLVVLTLILRVGRGFSLTAGVANGLTNLAGLAG